MASMSFVSLGLMRICFIWSEAFALEVVTVESSFGIVGADTKLDPTSSDELRLTRAISLQAAVVSQASVELTKAKERVNSTLLARSIAESNYDTVHTAADKAIERYHEAELAAAAAQDDRDFLRNETATAAAEVPELLGNRSSKAQEVREGVNATQGYAADNLTSAAKQAVVTKVFDQSNTSAIEEVEALLNRSRELQEAIYDLNAANDELVDVQEKLDEQRRQHLDAQPSTAISEPLPLGLMLKEVNDTMALKKQASRIGDLANKLLQLQPLANGALEARDSASQAYAVASEAAQNASSELDGKQGELEDLQENLEELAAQVQEATIDVLGLGGNLTEASRNYTQLLSVVLGMRDVVESVTEVEVKAKAMYDDVDKQLLQLQAEVDQKTDRLQEEIDKLNLLNDQLGKLYSR